ncbi:MAG: CAP domain-containing protein [Sandaracinaceae bacterium]
MPRHTPLLSLLSLGVLVGLLVHVPSAAAQDFDQGGEAQMLARINEMRSSQNLGPLVRHPALDAASRAHCSDMATQQELTHVSQSSGAPGDRVQAAGLTASNVAENVAHHRTTEEAHAALVASDAHRGNMLAEGATHVGLAALRTPRGIYLTQVFATVGSAAPAAPAPSSSAVTIIPAPAPEPAPLIAPGASAPVAAPGAPQAPVARVAPAVNAPANPNVHLEEQPGSNGTVVFERPGPGGPITAYWVYGNGRWWYYPLPPGAQPGMHLEHDPSVQGPPPGYPAHPGQPGAVAGQGPQATRIAPPRGPSPGQPQAQPQGGVLQPFGAPFFGTPPPPLTGTPTRAYRRAYRRWQREYQRWLRSQGAL